MIKKGRSDVDVITIIAIVIAVAAIILFGTYLWLNKELNFFRFLPGFNVSTSKQVPIELVRYDLVDGSVKYYDGKQWLALSGLKGTVGGKQLDEEGVGKAFGVYYFRGGRVNVKLPFDYNGQRKEVFIERFYQPTVNGKLLPSPSLSFYFSNDHFFLDGNNQLVKEVLNYPELEKDQINEHKIIIFDEFSRTNNFVSLHFKPERSFSWYIDEKLKQALTESGLEVSLRLPLNIDVTQSKIVGAEPYKQIVIKNTPYVLRYHLTLFDKEGVERSNVYYRVFEGEQFTGYVVVLRYIQQVNYASSTFYQSFSRAELLFYDLNKRKFYSEDLPKEKDALIKAVKDWRESVLVKPITFLYDDVQSGKKTILIWVCVKKIGTSLVVDFTKEVTEGTKCPIDVR